MEALAAYVVLVPFMLVAKAESLLAWLSASPFC